ncbi:NADPH:quinone oxidoreductase family protein [Azohydromonas australica]|uniref:NADPH:quinone oxidoreductase family protein n=1 Tax=Azohydromonas australica TaxID=364039 RepID=UPI0004279400|nr:NADPH:quinone oxidoreductase family protein [Azohydromonas australica]
MRALVCSAFGPIADLRPGTLPDPVPGEGQVLIEVKAASVNFPDALIVQGRYQVRPEVPFAPGAEASGLVRALGPGVQGFSVGDAVVASTGHGAFAELCLAQAAKVSRLPPGMDFEQGAAFVLTYGTSLHALQQVGRLQAGETLLVLGAAGGVGLAAIEIGKALGARVIAAASSEEKLALCRRGGADETVDYTQPEWRRRVEALTDGQGADVVYDAVGGAYAEAALRATAWRGRYLVVGFAAGEIPRLPLNLALLKERQILGVFWGEAMRRDPAQHTANMAQLGRWFAQGLLKPAITGRVPLAQAGEAIQRLGDRRAMGKLVVLPGMQA